MSKLKIAVGCLLAGVLAGYFFSEPLKMQLNASLGRHGPVADEPVGYLSSKQKRAFELATGLPFPKAYDIFLKYCSKQLPPRIVEKRRISGLQDIRKTRTVEAALRDYLKLQYRFSFIELEVSDFPMEDGLMEARLVELSLQEEGHADCDFLRSHPRIDIKRFRNIPAGQCPALRAIDEPRSDVFVRNVKIQNVQYDQTSLSFSGLEFIDRASGQRIAGNILFHAQGPIGEKRRLSMTCNDTGIKYSEFLMPK